MTYYSLFCLQNNVYMAIGRNYLTKEDVKSDLLGYLFGDPEDGPIEELSKYSPDELAGMYEFEIVEHSEKLPENY